MPKKIFKPYKNESEVLHIGDLTVENRVDRVSLYGSIDFTLDKEGLAYAREIKALLDLVLTALESAPDLPERVVLAQEELVKNPFSD